MKKIIFLISLLFVFSLFAQEAEPEENEAETPAEEAAEAAPAKTDDDKITVSKEELAKLVREAVAEEMAKKEAEKKEAEAKSGETVTAQAETKPGEAEKTEEAAAEKKEIHGTEDTNGLIQTSYTKSSIAFIMGDDNLRDNSQYSPKWDIGSRYEYEDFADRVYGYSNNVKSSTKLSLFHEEKGFLPYLTARMSLSFAMYNAVDAMSDKLITSVIRQNTDSISRFIRTTQTTSQSVLCADCAGAETLLFGRRAILRLFPDFRSFTATPIFRYTLVSRLTRSRKPTNFRQKSFLKRLFTDFSAVSPTTTSRSVSRQAFRVLSSTKATT